MSEERLIKEIFDIYNPPPHVKLKIVRIQGTGKRDALAAGFRAVSNSTVDLKNSVVSVIDGDSILSLGSTKACYSMFKLNPKLGALTTDEDCELYGDDFVTNLYRKWYSMRFAQRHIYMSSNGLAKKVLTLTGRMSMFRANVVTQKEFIETVQFDFVDHWRIGRFRFLTGDDKSSWFHLLRDGWQMWYIPDVMVLTIEEIPDRNFFKGATILMRRWFGNMLRTNGRALKLKRSHIGNFTWWNLWDQRISMWTSLFGLSAALIAAIAYDGTLMFIFIWWIAFTRFTQSLMLLSSRKNISITWPFLIYFNQIYGSLVKIYVLNNLSKQKWTRQKTTLKQSGSSFDNWYVDASSRVSFLASLLAFVTLVAFIVGAFDFFDIYQIGIYFKNIFS
jgi:glycosyltransferase Alg8